MAMARVQGRTTSVSSHATTEMSSGSSSSAWQSDAEESALRLHLKQVDGELCRRSTPPAPAAGGMQAKHWDRTASFQQWVAAEEWTTVMIRNLPSCFSRGRLIYLLCKEGFANSFDFLYVPLCFKEKVSLCYAFINFTSPSAVALFWKRFSGFRDWGFPSTQVAEVCWCARHQGLEEAIEYYRNNSVMHSSVPDECKPILISNSTRVQFPVPTKAIKVPKKVKNVEDSESPSFSSGGAYSGLSFKAPPMLRVCL